ncbi:aspartate/glutamate racemase family protein [Shewanella sp. 30m-9]
MNIAKQQSSANNLQELGLLGLGSRTTQFYFEQLNRQYHAHFSKDSTCPLLLLNTNFDEFNPYLPDQHSKLQPALIRYLERLQRINVQRVIIPNITLHESVDYIQLDDGKYPEIINPIAATIERLKEDKQWQVVLIGSFYSMNSSKLFKQFNDAGIAVTVPSEQIMRRIDAIRKRVYRYCEHEQDSDELLTLIASYQAHSTVVIACTELSIVSQAKSASIYDMVTIQLHEAIKPLL